MQIFAAVRRVAEWIYRHGRSASAGYPRIHRRIGWLIVVWGSLALVAITVVSAVARLVLVFLSARPSGRAPTSSSTQWLNADLLAQTTLVLVAGYAAYRFIRVADDCGGEHAVVWLWWLIAGAFVGFAVWMGVYSRSRPLAVAVVSSVVAAVAVLAGSWFAAVSIWVGNCTA